MDTKIIRAGIVSGTTLLLVGLLIGTYGGLDPVLKLTNNFLGASLLVLVLSILFTYIYAHWFANFLPGSILTKGFLFGGLVWTVFLILGGLFTFFKASVYPDINPANNLFLSLVLFCIWGAFSSISLETKN